MQLLGHLQKRIRDDDDDDDGCEATMMT